MTQRNTRRVAINNTRGRPCTNPLDTCPRKIGKGLSGHRSSAEWSRTLELKPSSPPRKPPPLTMVEWCQRCVDAPSRSSSPGDSPRWVPNSQPPQVQVQGLLPSSRQSGVASSQKHAARVPSPSPPQSGQPPTSSPSPCSSPRAAHCSTSPAPLPASTAPPLPTQPPMPPEYRTVQHRPPRDEGAVPAPPSHSTGCVQLGELPTATWTPQSRAGVRSQGNHPRHLEASHTRWQVPVAGEMWTESLPPVLPGSPTASGMSRDMDADNPPSPRGDVVHVARSDDASLCCSDASEERKYNPQRMWDLLSSQQRYHQVVLERQAARSSPPRETRLLEGHQWSPAATRTDSPSASSPGIRFRLPHTPSCSPRSSHVAGALISPLPPVFPEPACEYSGVRLSTSASQPATEPWQQQGNNGRPAWDEESVGGEMEAISNSSEDDEHGNTPDITSPWASVLLEEDLRRLTSPSIPSRGAVRVELHRSVADLVDQEANTRREISAEEGLARGGLHQGVAGWRGVAQSPEEALHGAIASRNTALVAEIAREIPFAALEARASDGATPLIAAVRCRLMPSIRTLLDCGVDPDGAVDIHGWSPLHHAAAYADTDALRLLLGSIPLPRRVAAVNREDRNRATPLDVVLSCGSGGDVEGAAELLLEAGATSKRALIGMLTPSFRGLLARRARASPEFRRELEGLRSDPEVSDQREALQVLETVLDPSPKPSNPVRLTCSTPFTAFDPVGFAENVALHMGLLPDNVEVLEVRRGSTVVVFRIVGVPGAEAIASHLVSRCQDSEDPLHVSLSVTDAVEMDAAALSHPHEEMQSRATSPIRTTVVEDIATSPIAAVGRPLPAEDAATSPLFPDPPRLGVLSSSPPRLTRSKAPPKAAVGPRQRQIVAHFAPPVESRETVLSCTEVSSIAPRTVSEVCLPQCNDAGTSFDVAAAAVQRFDGNGDGLITLNEWNKLLGWIRCRPLSTTKYHKMCGIYATSPLRGLGADALCKTLMEVHEASIRELLEIPPVGTNVRLAGLQNRPQLNGCTGEVVGYRDQIVLARVSGGCVQPFNRKNCLWNESGRWIEPPEPEPPREAVHAAARQSVRLKRRDDGLLGVTVKEWHEGPETPAWLQVAAVPPELQQYTGWQLEKVGGAPVQTLAEVTKEVGGNTGPVEVVMMPPPVALVGAKVDIAVSSSTRLVNRKGTVVETRRGGRVALVDIPGFAFALPVWATSLRPYEEISLAPATPAHVLSPRSPYEDVDVSYPFALSPVILSSSPSNQEQDEPPVSPLLGPPPSPRPGRKVTVRGLKSRPDLNGQIGTILHIGANGIAMVKLPTMEKAPLRLSNLIIHTSSTST
eukprot:Sspe_Gene.42263::Locus_20513_Transcript_1_1_Confidence_1.000_Length_4138::g.42263::m.42263